MAVAESSDLREYCLKVARRAQRASADLVRVTGAQKDLWLRHSARLLRGGAETLAEANSLDLAAASEQGLSAAQIDRLRLTPEGIEGMAVALEEIAALPDPVGEVIES